MNLLLDAAALAMTLTGFLIGHRLMFKADTDGTFNTSIVVMVLSGGVFFWQLLRAVA